MVSLTQFRSNQSQEVKQFTRLTGLNSRNAQIYLDRADGDIEEALNLYFLDIQSNNSHYSSFDKSKIQQAFNSYKNEQSNNIESEGIQRFCSDLGIDVLDPLILLISMHFKAQNMGVYTEKEFVEGFVKLQCEDIDQLRQKVPKLRQELQSPNAFRQMYLYVYEFSKEPGVRSLQFDTAVSLWRLLLGEKYPIVEDWIQFLESRDKKNDVSKDTWNMLLTFCETIARQGFQGYDPSGAWPILIDEFVEHYNSEHSQNKMEESVEISSSFSLNLAKRQVKTIPAWVFERAESLTILDLSHNQIYSLQNSGIDNLRRLVKLHLNDNFLVHLPTCLESLTLLYQLDVKNNQLKALDIDFNKLSHLQIINFSNNKISTLPKSIWQSQRLTDINISFNKIKKISSKIGRSRQLQILHLNQNQLSYLPSQIHLLTNLVEFTLEWFRYTIPPLPRILRGHVGLPLIRKLRDYCEQLDEDGIYQCTLHDFLNHFSKDGFTLHPQSNRRSALHTAVLEGDIGVVKGLINSGIDSNILDNDYNSPLMLSLASQKTAKLAWVLLDGGADVNFCVNRFGSPLHLACKILNVQLVQRLLNDGIMIHWKDIDGNTPLHIVFTEFSQNTHNAEKIAQLLLENGYNPNLRNKDNWASLHITARKGCHQAIKWAFVYNNQSKDTHRPLFDFNIKGGIHNWTPLHIAAQGGNLRCTHYLLRAGSYIFAENLQGKTAKQAAKSELAVYKYLWKMENYFISNQTFEDKTQKEEPLERLQSFKSYPMWKTYQILYESFENKDINQIIKISNQSKGSIQTEAIYMLTLLDPSLINKLKLDALSNLVYREFDLAKNCDHQHSPPQNDQLKFTELEFTDRSTDD